MALLISVIAHGAILLRYPNFYLPSPKEKEQKMEVSYIKPSAQEKRQQKAERLFKREQLLNLPPKIALENRVPPPFTDNDNNLKPLKAREPLGTGFTKPSVLKPDILAIKKKITLPPIDMNKINNPSYISYYQIVREKIKRSAYQNYTGREVGEVTVSFVISNDGMLRELLLIEERSYESAYLRETALRSVKDASPFPNFPADLDYPQLSFNLAITFEIE